MSKSTQKGFAGYSHHFYFSLLVVLGLLIASGVLLIPQMIEMRLDIDSPVSLNGDVRLASAALHSFTSFITMVFIGALSSTHMRIGWNKKKNRYSGIGMIILFFVLLISAIGIYYFGDVDFSRWSSMVHLFSGIILAQFFIFHFVLAKIKSVHL